MQFTKIPENAFENMQLNAGVLLSTFDPATGKLSLENIIGATTGGSEFKDTPSFTDYGDDVDNAPKNSKELKRIDSREIKLTGTYISVDIKLLKDLVASADIDKQDETKIVPRDTLTDADFKDVWLVADYGDNGFVAIHLMNALNTGGFSLKTGDKSKGQFAFEYTAHYSLKEQDKVPYEIYVKKTTTAGSVE